MDNKRNKEQTQMFLWQTMQPEKKLFDRKKSTNRQSFTNLQNEEFLER